MTPPHRRLVVWASGDPAQNPYHDQKRKCLISSAAQKCGWPVRNHQLLPSGPRRCCVRRSRPRLPASQRQIRACTEEDLDRLEAEASKNIDINYSFPLASMDPVYFETLIPWARTKAGKSLISCWKTQWPRAAEVCQGGLAHR